MKSALCCRTAFAAMLVLAWVGPAEAADAPIPDDDPAARRRLQELAASGFRLGTGKDSSASRFSCQVVFAYGFSDGRRHPLRYAIERDGERSSVVLILPGDVVHGFACDDVFYFPSKVVPDQLETTAGRSFTLRVPYDDPKEGFRLINFSFSEDERQNDPKKARAIMNEIGLEFRPLCEKLLNSKSSVRFGDSDRVILVTRDGPPGAHARIDWSRGKRDQLQIDSLWMGDDQSVWLSITAVCVGDATALRRGNFRNENLLRAGLKLSSVELGTAEAMRRVLQGHTGIGLSVPQRNTGRRLFEVWKDSQRVVTPPGRPSNSVR